VLRAAQQKLEALERQGHADPRQPDLFHDVPAERSDAEPSAGSTAALERLAALDPDRLSPRDALAELYELKALADGRPSSTDRSPSSTDGANGAGGA
jgi:DNA mismatch repair protein MutS